MTPSRHLVLLALAAVASCGGSSDPATDAPSPVVTRALPAMIEIAGPTDPVRRLELVEDFSEEVADWLLDFSDKLRRRDFSAARGWLSDSFAGHGWSGLAVAREEELRLDARRTVFDAATASIVGPGDFLAGIREHIGPWARMESSLWKVKKADFEASGGEQWGKVKLFLHLLGTGEDGGRRSLSGWAYARVEKRRGKWWIERFELTEFTALRRSGPVFTDVSTSTGVARSGIRFGAEGNQSFAWNGAAAGDVDGNGRWDVFLPSDGRNYLYLAGEDGLFTEEAEERGVAQPDQGTGAVFFDADGDGDQDLALGQTSWRDGDKLAGTPIQFFTGDGLGRFRGRALEDDPAPWVAYSLTVLDYDLDGRLDLYVCGYGRVEVEHNNDWIEATNGSPNALFHNLGGGRFEEVGERMGVRGQRWSYASAAADFDNDGDTDLYVSNDYGSNRLYRNDRERFTDVADVVGVTDRGNGMGVAWGDLDADGWLDLYSSNMSSTAGNRILDRLESELDPERYQTLKKLAAGNTIFHGSPVGKFEPYSASAGGINGNWAWSPALCDFDLDGLLDVFLANGYVTGDLPHDT